MPVYTKEYIVRVHVRAASEWDVTKSAYQTAIRRAVRDEIPGCRISVVSVDPKHKDEKTPRRDIPVWEEYKKRTEMPLFCPETGE